MAPFQKIALCISILILVSLSASANESLPQNPKTLSLPGFGVWSEEAFQTTRPWYDQRWAFLGQSEVPWIKTKMHLRRVSSKYGPDEELTEEQYFSRLEEKEAIMRQAPTDLLSQVVLANNCGGGLIETCQMLGVYDRIIEQDSDNICAYLWPIKAVSPARTYSTSYGRASLADSPSVRKYLISASNAGRYVEYSDMASIDWYSEHLEFVRAYPPPTSEQRSNPDYALAFVVAGKAPFWDLGRTDIVSLCLFYLDQAEEEMVSACERLAGKLQKYRQQSGFAIADLFAKRRKIFDAESLRLQRLNRVYDRTALCLKPRWLEYKSLLPATRHETVEAYLSDLVTHGRWIANQNAALLEYTENQSLYDEDPVDCAGYLDLDSEALAEVLGGDDPYGSWVAARERAEEEKELQSDAWKDPTEEELAELAARLDYVESISDPIVSALGAQGLKALPLLLDLLCAESRLSALAAAYAIAEIADTATIGPVLERMTSPWRMGQACEFRVALSSTLERTRDRHRRLIQPPADPDYDILMSKIICSAENLTIRNASDFDPSISRLVVVNTSPNVEGAYEKSCFGGTLHVIPYDPNPPRFKTKDIEVARMGVQFFDFGDDLDELPEFEAKYGGQPQSIAMVKYIVPGVSKGGDLWVKVNGDWSKLAEIYR